MARPLLAIIAGILCLRQALVVSSQFVAYNETKAIEYAHLAGASYCSQKSLERWDCPHCIAPIKNVKVCHSKLDKTAAFVGRWDNDCIISFEGTETYKSMWTDLRVYNKLPVEVWLGCKGAKNCKVHAGYYATWRSLSSCIVKGLESNGCTNKISANGTNGSQLRVTGHSMGAAVSSIAMMALEYDGWIIRDSYNFGMPRTGNGEFAQGLINQFEGRLWRVTHHKDIIVQVPPPMWNFSWAYVHTGLEAFYDGNLTQGHKMCMSPEDKECSKQYWDLLFDDWGMYDHLHYLGIHFGKAGCGEALDDLDVPLQQSLLDLPPQQTLMV